MGIKTRAIKPVMYRNLEHRICVVTAVIAADTSDISKVLMYKIVADRTL